MEESQKFYESVFDLKFRSRGERPELKVKFINLEDENQSVIELFEHEKPIPLTDDLMDFQKVGINPLALILLQE